MGYGLELEHMSLKFGGKIVWKMLIWRSPNEE